MAVHAISGNLTINTATTATLTSWEKYVLVTVTSDGTAGKVSVTTDGTTATVAGADTATLSVPVGATVTFVVKNNLPRPNLSTTTPLPTDPAASPVFTTAQSKVSIISDRALAYNVDLCEEPGTYAVYN